MLYGRILEGDVNGASLTYHTGEEVQAGDVVTHNGHPGQIEFVANPSSPSPETEWFIEEFGGGVMVKDSKIGSVFISIESMDNPGDLAFVGRKELGPAEGKAQ